MSEVILIGGSPSRRSRSSAVLEHVQAQLAQRGIAGVRVSVRDLPAEDLLFGNFESAAIREQVALIEQARAVVVATPIYKAAYSGVLKAYLDLLPQTALRGKVVLPLATGGSPAHLLAINYSLKPVLAALGATTILDGVYVVDSQVQSGDGEEYFFHEEVLQRLERAVEAFAEQLFVRA